MIRHNAFAKGFRCVLDKLAGEPGRNALSLVLTIAMVTALVPAQAIPALAEELDDTLSQGAGEQIIEDETPMAAPDLGDSTEGDEGLTGEGTSLDTDDFQQSDDVSQELTTFSMAPMLRKGPSASAVNVEVSYGSDSPIDGVYQQRTVYLTVTAAEGVTLGADFPSAVLTYTDAEYDDHEATYSSVNTWSVAADGRSATCGLNALYTGTYHSGKISGIKTSSGDVEAEFSLDGFKVVAEPTVTKIWLKDSNGNWITEEGSSQYFNVLKALRDDTVEKPVVKNGGTTVVVRVEGALDAAESIEHSTKDESNSYVALVNEGGKEIAVANLVRVSEGAYEATFTRQLDNSRDLTDIEPRRALPEEPIGVKIVALDKFGTQLKTTVDGNTYDYGLVAATVEKSGEEYKAKADGTFILDKGAPVITMAYPQDEVVTEYDGTASGAVIKDVPGEVGTMHIFDHQISVVATIADSNLDMDQTTFDGHSITEIKAAGSGGLVVNGATYKMTVNMDGGGANVTVTYADGAYNPPVVVAKDFRNTVTYDGATELGIDRFMVDATVPVVTAATIGSTPANIAVDASNRVVFFGSGTEAPLTLYVTEPHGIRSVEITAADGYTLSGGLSDAIGALNPRMIDGTFDGAYELKVIDTLLNERELSDNLALTITDFAGNQCLWSLDAQGLSKQHADHTVSTTSNADLLYEALGGTALLHPTILVWDDIKPVVTLNGPQDRTDAAAAGYERFFASPQDVSLKVVEFNMRYLRSHAAGTEGATNINDTYTGHTSLGTDGKVMTITYTPPAAGGTPVNSFVTANSLTYVSNGVYTWAQAQTANGDYQITAKVVDAAGNESNEATIAAFTIDMVKPNLTVAFDNNDSSGKSTSGHEYFKAGRKATITVVEHNFDPNLFTVSATLEPGTAMKGYAGPSVSAWVNDGDTHTCTVDFDTDGTYKLDVGGKDKAGNEADAYNSNLFTIDKEAPVIAKYVMSDEPHAPGELVVVMPERTGEYAGVSYYNKILELKAQIKDRNFDKDDTTLDGAAVTWTGGSVDENGYETYETTKSYNKDGEYHTPAIVTCDMAGNTSRNDDPGDAAHYNVRSFVVDLEAPTIQVSASPSPAAQGTNAEGLQNFYNAPSGATLSFTVLDGHALKDVKLADPDGVYGTPTWNKSPLGEKQVSGTITLLDNAKTSHAEFEDNIILTATDIAGNERTWSISPTGTVMQVQGPPADNAAIHGDGQHQKRLIQDATSPIVSLSGVEAGAYYNTPQSVTASVNEYNFDWLKLFDGNRAIVTVTKYEANAGRAMSSSTVVANAFSGGLPNYANVIPFATDGHYTLRAQFADYATNQSNEASIGEFTIDTTPPQVSMTFDNNDVRNEMYYKATRTATITVEEHNFDSSLMNIETEGRIDGWSNNGDTHVCTVFFGEGGPYTITVGGKDLAGNEAVPVSEPAFIVDLTAPQIDIAGTAQRLGYVGDGGELTNAYHDKLEDKSAYNGVVVPVITYTDNEALSSDDLAHSMSGTKHGQDVEHEASLSGEGKEMFVTLRDLGYVGPDAGDGSNWENFYVDDYDVDADDIYTIKATMTDQAGNEAEAELTFSVNRYGSNYDVQMRGMSEEELEEYQRSGMLSEAPTIVVREVNVSGVAQDSDHHVEKEFANATTPINLAGGEGAGYGLAAVDPGQAQNGWSEYIYTVRSANFGEGSDSDHNDRGQGVYRVNVMSDDTSSNANTTADYWSSDEKRTQVKAEGATAEFVLDELGPVIDDLDLPKGISRGESYEASFHVTDDITSGNTVVVEVDGRELPAGEVHGPSNGAGTFTFTVPAKAFNWHRSVKITVTDYAGRVASEGNHTWAWQSTFIPEAGLVGLAMAVIAAAVVFARRRKDAAEPELPNL